MKTIKVRPTLVEIEMEEFVPDNGINLNGGYHSEPKLINGSITIINEEPILYTEEEVKDLLKLCLKEFSTTSKIDIPCVDEWFEQNKKK